MKHLWVLALGLAGCDSVFGFHHFDYVPPDGPGTPVTGRLVRQVIHNDASSAPTLDEVPMTSANAMLRTSDGEVALAADGTFTFTTAALPFQLEVALDQELPYEMQSSATMLDLTDIWVGRTPRMPPSLPALIDETIVNAPATGFDVLQSTGLWASGTVPGTSSTRFTFDWRSATPAIGSIALLDATAHDRLYTLHYDFASDGINLFTGLDNWLFDDVTMISGQTTTLVGNFTALQKDQCARIIALEATESGRLVAVDPSYQLGSGEWSLFAFPPGAFDFVGSPSLAGRGLGPEQDDTANMVHFGNPFPGTTVVAIMLADATRKVRLGTAASTDVHSGTLEMSPVTAAASCGATTTTLGRNIAVPGEPKLAGARLDSDDQPIQIDRTGPVALELSLASPGIADYYSVALFAVGQSSGTTTLTLVRDYLTTETTVLVDPKLLVIATTYLVEVAVHAGQPNAKQGDLRTHSFPRGAVTIASRTFAIVN